VSFASGVGGAVAGAAVGYVVRGRAGGVVGAVLGGVGGYNIDAFTSFVVPAREDSTAKQSRPSRLGLSSVSGGAASRASVDRDSVSTAITWNDEEILRLKTRGYDASAKRAPSEPGDPFGSFRVYRDRSVELTKLVDGPAETAIRSIVGVATLGLSELAIQAGAAARADSVDRSIAEYPTAVFWSVDWPPARTLTNIDDGTAFTAQRRDRIVELYGPTENDVQNAAKRGEYYANVNGKPHRLSRDAAAAAYGAFYG